jgi:hypothetical protein
LTTPGDDVVCMLITVVVDSASTLCLAKGSTMGYHSPAPSRAPP